MDQIPYDGNLFNEKTKRPELGRNIIIFQNIEELNGEGKVLTPFVYSRRYNESLQSSWIAGFATDPLIVGWCYPEDLLDFVEKYIEFMKLVKLSESKKLENNQQ